MQVYSPTEQSTGYPVYPVTRNICVCRQTYNSANSFCTVGKNRVKTTPPRQAAPRKEKDAREKEGDGSRAGREAEA